MQNVHFREAKFPRGACPRIPLVLDPIFAELILNCFCQAFSVEKGAPSILYRDINFKDCKHKVHSSLKCIPLEYGSSRDCYYRISWRLVASHCFALRWFKDGQPKKLIAQCSVNITLQLRIMEFFDSIYTIITD